MSYVGAPFEYDLFVTYSHGDATGDGDSLLRMWSQGFAKQLEAELRASMEMGRNLRLFLDQHHRANQSVDPLLPLTEQLKQAIGSSAIITVLMSPHYLDSKWCQDERDWWRDAQVEHRLAHEGRIAIVKIWPSPEGAVWPELFLDSRGQPLVGYCFYDPKEELPRCRPFGWTAPTQATGEPFRGRLLDLVSGISRSLNDLRKRIELRQKVATDAARLAGDEQVVYLHGRADDVKRWEETSDGLSSSGLTVLPADPDPIESTLEKAQEARNRRVEMMSSCDAVLLLGSANGRAVDSDLVTVGRHERQLARALSNRFLPCALLDTVGDPIATERRRLAARKLQVDWIDRKNEPWVPSVRDWLNRKGQDLEATR